MAGVVTRQDRRLSDEAPPPDPREPDGGDGGWALLTVAGNQVLAYLIRGRLVAEGIEVLLDSSNASPAAWLHPFGDPSSPVRIFVRRTDLTAATLLLHEVDQPSGVPAPLGAAGPEIRRASWLGFRLFAALAAALALSGLLLFGPCVSHWFCV
ncbi:MAG TPA: hypothetical protein VET24_00230 [Actinomycetota bacterium]|nr:hypothetical protein [Actinomycetota bacterium]